MAGQLFSLYPIPSGVTGTLVSGGNNKPVSGLGRSNWDGINLVWGVYSTTTTTLSISDVVHLCSVPEGATILDGWICGIVKTGTGMVVKVGVQAAGNPSATGVSTDGDLRTSVTLSTTRVLARFDGVTGGLPYQTAAIAAATYPKQIPVVLTCVSGTNTASVSIGFYLAYTAAGQ
jgi:hypothetical protein